MIGIKQQQPVVPQRDLIQNVLDLSCVVNVCMPVHMVGKLLGDFEGTVATTAIDDVNVIGPARDAA